MSVMDQAAGADVQTDQAQDSFPSELQPLLDQAVEILYGDNFENLVKMFEGGPEAFPNAMATAITAVLARLERDNGEIDQESIAMIGGRLFEMLLEDLVAGGVVEDVTPEMATEAIQKTMSMWLRDNQKRVDPNETGQSLQELVGALREGGVLEEGQPQQQPVQGQEVV